MSTRKTDPSVDPYLNYRFVNIPLKVPPGRYFVDPIGMWIDARREWLRAKIPGRLPDHSAPRVVGVYWCMSARTELPDNFYDYTPSGRKKHGIKAVTFGAYCSASLQGIRCACGAGEVGHDPGDEDVRP